MRIIHNLVPFWSMKYDVSTVTTKYCDITTFFVYNKLTSESKKLRQSTVM